MIKTKDSTKKKLVSLLIILVFGGSTLAFAILFAFPSGNNGPTGDGIADELVHWHATLSIEVNGKDVPVPAGVGLQYAGQHPSNIHTHGEDQVLHKEGPSSLTLQEFFAVWGRIFDKECIFDNCNDDGGTVKFFVNGVENSEFENYPFQDKDVMEIVYE